MQADISALIAAAKEYVLEHDRRRLDPYFRAIERLIEENSLILGGKVSVDIIMHAPKTADSYMYEIYSAAPEESARQIADAVFDEARRRAAGSPPIVACDTLIPGHDYSVSADGRLLCRVLAMKEYRGIPLMTAIRPAPHPGYFGAQVLCMSPELHLVAIYRALYSPFPENYETAELLEGQMTAMISKTLAETAVKSVPRVVGGAPAGPAKRFVNHMKDSPEFDFIIVGDYALNKLMGVRRPYARLELITAEPIKQVAAVVRRVLGLSTNAVKYIKFALNIPSDYQIVKHVIYINGVGTIDVYNSTAYEMVPYYTRRDLAAIKGDRPADNGRAGGGLRYGTYWVLLRFMYINLWVLKLIISMQTSAKEFLKGRTNEVVSAILALRGETTKVARETLFILQYAGVYMSEAVARKKMLKGRTYPRYYPAAER